MDDTEQDKLSLERHLDLERALFQVRRLLEPWEHYHGVQAVFGTRAVLLLLEHRHLILHLRLELLHRVLGAAVLLQVVVALEDTGLGQRLTTLFRGPSVAEGPIARRLATLEE